MSHTSVYTYTFLLSVTGALVPMGDISTRTHGRHFQHDFTNYLLHQVIRSLQTHAPIPQLYFHSAYL